MAIYGVVWSRGGNPIKIDSALFIHFGHFTQLHI